MNAIYRHVLIVSATLIGLTGCHNDFVLNQMSALDIVCREGSFHPEKTSGIVGGARVSAKSKFSKKVVYLMMGDRLSGYQACTGTLIDRDVILTAAHCVEHVKYQPSKITAYFGTQPGCDKKKKSNRISAQNVQVHSKYNAHEVLIGSYDLALVHLSKEAPTSYQLTKLSEDLRRLRPDTNILVAGYGATVGGKKRDMEPSTLKAVWRRQLQGESLDRMKGILKQLRKTKFLESDEEIFAESSSEQKFIWLNQLDKVGACYGDSGGPSFIQKSGDFIQVGVASLGLQDSQNTVCLRSSKYVGVAANMDWIRSAFKRMKRQDFKNGK